MRGRAKNQININFSIGQKYVYVVDCKTDEQFSVPQRVVDEVREYDVNCIIINPVTKKYMLMNAFEITVDSIDVIQQSTYQFGEENYYCHIFKPIDKDYSEYLTSTELILLSRFNYSWYNLLRDFFETQLRKITKEIRTQREKEIEIYPKQEDTFNAFKMPISNIKCVFFGQDSYPNYNANGIAFSSKVKTPSLEMMNKALSDNIKLDYTLKHWVKQGVLLLNAGYTVVKGVPNSHVDLWQPFNKEVITVINLLPKPIPILLIGGTAQKYLGSKFDVKRHLVINVEHPARASYEERTWNHEDCFNRINDFLRENNEEEIKWI